MAFSCASFSVFHQILSRVAFLIAHHHESNDFVLSPFMTRKETIQEYAISPPISLVSLHFLTSSSFFPSLLPLSTPLSGIFGTVASIPNIFARAGNFQTIQLFIPSVNESHIVAILSHNEAIQSKNPNHSFPFN